MAKKANLYNSTCPSRSILELIGSKWAMLIICTLTKGPTRTGALKRHIDGVSQKMLTQTLRDLERHGILQRIDYAEVPPRVEYKLTRMGESLSELVRQMEDWLVAHYPRMTNAAHSFDQRGARRSFVES
jgi:DNA-binding HxlR family transcriptional regulator